MRTVGLGAVGVVVALVSACGGDTKRTPGDVTSGGTDAAGASGSGGTSSGAGEHSAAGSFGLGAAGSSGLGGGGVAGANTATGGAASGAGGLPGDGEDLLACDEPSGGPRVDGPDPILGPCDAIPDAVLVARFESFAGRVPRGFFYDAKPWRGLWLEPCASAPEQTAEAGPQVGLVGVPHLFTTPWFHEASFCGDGPRRSVRNLRCDYFDGKVLAERTPENLAFLASILWWVEHQNDSDRALLGYSVTVGDATDWVDVCTLSGARGDFGLCDEIRLERARHSVFQDGTVRLGEPALVRVVQGACR